MKKLHRLIVLMLVCVLLTGCVGNPYRLGVRSLEEGDYVKATQEFTQAIEKEKNLADSYRGLGIALWEQKDYQGAFEAFEKSISEGTEPTATLYSLLGNSAMQIEKYDKAVDYYELAIGREDISEQLLKEIRYNLIAAYEYAGNVTKAKEAVQEYLEKYPDDEEVLREAEFLETR